MTAPVAELIHVGRSFNVHGNTHPVLTNLSLTIFPRDRIVLFGPSGCGKTTLLHLLGLLDTPDTGDHLFLGTAVGGLDEKQRSRIRAQEIGLVFQSFHLLPFHSVRENILLRARYLPAEQSCNEEALQEILSRVGLAATAAHPARLLSGGEKQRVCIARALIHHPSLFLADEPTGNLDRENSHTIRKLFEHVAEHAPVVVATHDPEWIPFATRVLRFTNGTLTEESSP